MTDLDERFGVVAPAQSHRAGQKPINDWEFENFPKSKMMLTPKSAKHFKALMESVVESFKPNETVYNGVLVLWVVDYQGRIFFAVEELVDKNHNPCGIPAHMIVRGDDFPAKLGHPSLLAGADARIAGEIYYHSPERVWVINRRSGRYSIPQGRTLEQLENVVSEFKKFGLHFVVKGEGLA